MNLVYGIDRPVDSLPRRLTAEDVSQSHESSRCEVRNSIASEMELFLQRGGLITKIEPHEMADPPTKPISGYGKGAI